MRDQLLQASQSNLSPLFVEVFVTGRVKNPGGIVVPQGSSVNQAIALAGGAKVLGGKIEFVRFTKEGEIERQIFRFDPGASVNAPNNPLISSGDLIRIQESPLSTVIDALNEVTMPAVGIYSVYSLFNGTNQ